MKFVSCTLLLVTLCSAVILPACTSSRNDVATGAFADSETITLKVDGMACRNCANEIARELKQVPGVKDAMVNFDQKQAIVALDDTNPASRNDLNAAIIHWKVEHFGLEVDPDCEDPQRREEIKAAEREAVGG